MLPGFRLRLVWPQVRLARAAPREIALKAGGWASPSTEAKIAGLAFQETGLPKHQ